MQSFNLPKKPDYKKKEIQIEVKEKMLANNISEEKRTATLAVIRMAKKVRTQVSLALLSSFEEVYGKVSEEDRNLILGN